jgi:Uma2 family endonuclease
MAVMSVTGTWPPGGQAFTVADLDRMPDDGRRYELVDGVLLVSPRPVMAHQVVMFELALVLNQAAPADLIAVPEPAMQLTADTEFDPDIAVVRDDVLGAAKVTEPPLLVVEVQSPSTALIDLNVKKAAYERFGIDAYWIVVPDPDEPELTAFELADGRYELVAKVTGDDVFPAQRPFAVEVQPSALVARLRRAGPPQDQAT